MKIIDDSERIKKMLKNYDPTMAGERTKPKLTYSKDKLTNLLKIVISQDQDINKRTESVLLSADEILEMENVKEYSICQNGCAHCCKIPVSVTTMEANLIKEHTEKELRTYPHKSKEKIKYEYCPFLDQKNANCTIYPVRPLHCRCFHTFDHYKYCEDLNTPHLILKVESDERLRWLHDILLKGSDYYYADIRDWFEQ
ncbi:YkgJ family cysteine cluster protein [Enterobacter cloacae]|uniref:YkgJ family cysteine cluster protein n=1 Tax=Enterobacterales TaxID=91347 RepID=UPI0024BA8D43|nr:YkgJ family cysteine cluster protein [Morganella morganii]